MIQVKFYGDIAAGHGDHVEMRLLVFVEIIGYEIRTSTGPEKQRRAKVWLLGFSLNSQMRSEVSNAVAKYSRWTVNVARLVSSEIKRFSSHVRFSPKHVVGATQKVIMVLYEQVSRRPFSSGVERCTCTQSNAKAASSNLVMGTLAPIFWSFDLHKVQQF